MDKIFVTGDTHGQYDLDKVFNFATKHKKLDKNDFLIILGDFGLIWNNPGTKEFEKSEKFINKLQDLPFTVLFLDGNHENFKLLNKYPQQEWNGGKIHIIRESVFHLQRGYVFELANKKIFVLGGATSIDKNRRTKDVSWWAEENISDQDMEKSFENLKKHNYKVDYILTHTAPSTFADIIKERFYFKHIFDFNEAHLEDVKQKTAFTKWYCGHFHEDFTYENFNTLYRKIIQLED